MRLSRSGFLMAFGLALGLTACGSAPTAPTSPTPAPAPTPPPAPAPLNVTGGYTGLISIVYEGQTLSQAITSASITQTDLTVSGTFVAGDGTSGTFGGTLSDLSASARFAGHLRLTTPSDDPTVRCVGESGESASGEASPTFRFVVPLLPLNAGPVRCDSTLRDVTITLVR